MPVEIARSAHADMFGSGAGERLAISLLAPDIVPWSVVRERPQVFAES